MTNKNEKNIEKPSRLEDLTGEMRAQHLTCSSYSSLENDDAGYAKRLKATVSEIESDAKRSNLISRAIAISSLAIPASLSACAGYAAHNGGCTISDSFAVSGLVGGLSFPFIMVPLLYLAEQFVVSDHTLSSEINNAKQIVKEKLK
jgi:ABC-type glycerol-3-phosphate transport system permease component